MRTYLTRERQSQQREASPGGPLPQMARAFFEPRTKLVPGTLLEIFKLP
ncbi:MAG TPA: hypothetical protein VFF06_31585 [Polyangia bacterium]|nr:hypothetical protein [Polyangia bacterium]